MMTNLCDFYVADSLPASEKWLVGSAGIEPAPTKKVIPIDFFVADSLPASEKWLVGSAGIEPAIFAM